MICLKPFNWELSLIFRDTRPNCGLYNSQSYLSTVDPLTAQYSVFPVLIPPPPLLYSCTPTSCTPVPPPQPPTLLCSHPYLYFSSTLNSEIFFITFPTFFLRLSQFLVHMCQLHYFLDILFPDFSPNFHLVVPENICL